MIRISFGHFCEIHLPISLKFSDCPGYGTEVIGGMLTFGSRLQKKLETNHFCEFQGCRCYVFALLEHLVVADYCAEAY